MQRTDLTAMIEDTYALMNALDEEVELHAQCREGALRVIQLYRENPGMNPTEHGAISEEQAAVLADQSDEALLELARRKAACGALVQGLETFLHEVGDLSDLELRTMGPDRLADILDAAFASL